MASTVAIVGRPNVGKSTLFNRLVGRRRAIVNDQPGITRDRISAALELEPGRRLHLIDTGGLVPGEDPLGLNQQVRMAILESDLILMMVDGKVGLLPADQEVWHELRAYGRPTILVVNKGDTQAARAAFTDFYRLGIATQLLVSAEHGQGIEELRQEIAAALPAEMTEPEPEAPALAIVGRPNVGKSSLVNRLLEQPRCLVSEVPGTTRDPVDTLLRREGGPDWLLVDTAGIRRRSQVSGTPEELAVMMARRQIERAQVVVLVIDAAHGVSGGDLAIAGTAWEQGRAAVVAVNKWDLLEGDAEARERLEGSFTRLDQILCRPPRVNLSAKTGRGIAKLLPAVDLAYQRFRFELPTSEVNRLFERAVARHGPPAESGRPLNLLYATQVSTGPPTFMVFASRGLPRQHSYRRYLENQLREALDLPGVPVRLVVRTRREADHSRP